MWVLFKKKQLLQSFLYHSLANSSNAPDVPTLCKQATSESKANTLQHLASMFCNIGLEKPPNPVPNNKDIRNLEKAEIHRHS